MNAAVVVRRSTALYLVAFATFTAAVTVAAPLDAGPRAQHQPSSQGELCDMAATFAVKARTEHDNGVPLEKVLSSLDPSISGMTPFVAGFMKRTARAVYSVDLKAPPAAFGAAWKNKCLSIGKDHARSHAAAAVSMPARPGPNATPKERCTLGGEFVEYAREQHDMGLPLDLFMSGLKRAQPKLTQEEYTGYENLARLAYGAPPGPPASLRRAYEGMCLQHLGR